MPQYMGLYEYLRHWLCPLEPLFKMGINIFIPNKNHAKHYNMFGRRIILLPQSNQNMTWCSGSFRTLFIILGYNNQSDASSHIHTERQTDRHRYSPILWLGGGPGLGHNSLSSRQTNHSTRKLSPVIFKGHNEKGDFVTG